MDSEKIIPGFPGGVFCPACFSGWLIIAFLIYKLEGKMNGAEILGYVAVLYGLFFLYNKFVKK